MIAIASEYLVKPLGATACSRSKKQSWQFPRSDGRLPPCSLTGDIIDLQNHCWQVRIVIHLRYATPLAGFGRAVSFWRRRSQLWCRMACSLARLLVQYSSQTRSIRLTLCVDVGIVVHNAARYSLRV